MGGFCDVSELGLFFGFFRQGNAFILDKKSFKNRK